MVSINHLQQNLRTFICNREGYELIPEGNSNEGFLTEHTLLTGKYEDGGIEAHVKNWCDCIREQSIETNSPMHKGAFATILAHMGKI